MRRSAPSVHRLSSSAAATTESTMSAPPRYYGGRNRKQTPRTFSGNSSNEHAATAVAGVGVGRGGTRGGRGRGQFANRESHFRAVREANLTHRLGGRGSNCGNPLGSQNYNYTDYSQNQRVQYPRNSNFNEGSTQRPGFIHTRPDFDPRMAGLHRPQPYDSNLGFQSNQQHRPRRPKPADYRNWRYAKTKPPADCERFVVLSYNILADYLAMSHRGKLYFHIPRHMLEWEWRKKNILFELGLWSADIMCFQEVDRFHDLEEELKLRGYSGIWKMRTGDPVDGCAIFWRTTKFKLLYEESIEYNKLGLRDNVAQICVFELLGQSFDNGGLNSLKRVAGSNKVVVCNIHVLYNPRRGEIKLGQVRILLEKAHAVSKTWDDAPVVLCGDFNCIPKSPLYNFISEQKIRLCGLDRDKVSGQALAEVALPSPPYRNPQGQPADSQNQALIDDKVNNRAVLGQNQDNIVSNNNMKMDMPDESCSKQCDKDKETSELTENRQQAASEGVLYDEQLLVVHASSMVSDKSPDGGNLPLNYGGLKHFYSTLSSEGAYCNVPEAERGDTLNCSSQLTHTSSKLPDMDNLEPKENINSISMTSCVGEDHAETKKINLTGRSSPTATPQKDIFENFEVSLSATAEKISIQSAVDASYMDLLADSIEEKLKNVSINELDDPNSEGGNLLEDDGTFLAALHNSDDGVPFPSDQVGSELSSFDFGLDEEKTTYDPSTWSPTEIATATGGTYDLQLEHPLKLKSTYADVGGFKDDECTSGEPSATSYNRRFLGTVDYIWHSERLQTVRVLAPIPKDVMQSSQGFPTKKWGSDHIALVSELALARSAAE